MNCGSPRRGLRLLSLFGLVLSLYAVYVEAKHAADPNFEALCDFAQWGISCSKVFASAYGHLFFGVPNAVFGSIFYIGIFLLTVLTFIPYRRELVLLGCVVSSCLSLYLSTCLYHLGDFCIVCVSTYVINFIMLQLSWKYWDDARQKLKST